MPLVIADALLSNQLLEPVDERLNDLDHSGICGYVGNLDPGLTVRGLCPSAHLGPSLLL